MGVLSLYPLLLAALGTVAVLLVLQTLVYRIKRYSALSHIPGPPTTGWSRLWLVRGNLAGNLHKVFLQANLKYGLLARVGPYLVISSDPDLIRRMNAARTLYVRGEFYEPMRFYPNRDNLVTCPPAKHVELRAKMAAGYSGKEVESLEPRVDANVLALIDLLEKYVAQNKPFDFGRKAQYFTLDVISDVAHSEPFGFPENDRDQYDYLAISEKQLGFLLNLTVYTRIFKLLSSPLLVSPPSHT